MLDDFILKGEKETTLIISFVGDKAEDIVLFVAKAYSDDNQIMVIDLSREKKILISVAGNDNEQTVYIRKICYTVSENLYLTDRYKYDMVLIYYDCTREVPSFMKTVDYMYLCYGMQRHSLYYLEKNFSITYLGVPYDLVLRGVSDSNRVRMAKDLYFMLSAKRTKAERIYNIPICEKDILSLLQLEYDAMEIENLSEPMRKLICGIKILQKRKSLESVKC